MKIFAGPMWSHVPVMQAGESESSIPAVNTMNPVNVSSHKNVNILFKCCNLYKYRPW